MRVMESGLAIPESPVYFISLPFYLLPVCCRSVTALFSVQTLTDVKMSVVWEKQRCRSVTPMLPSEG